jgi:hypothetical protein
MRWITLEQKIEFESIFYQQSAATENAEVDEDNVARSLPHSPFLSFTRAVAGGENWSNQSCCHE